MSTIIAFDQSYARTGVALAIDGKLKWSSSWSPCKSSNTEKRRNMRRLVKRLTKFYKPDFVTVERIRMFSGGNVSMAVIMSLGALTLTVVDAAWPLETYSIDTRSWKSKILGSAKASKQDGINYISSLGFEVDNDDQGDAGCMALYASRSDALLKLEK